MNEIKVSFFNCENCIHKNVCKHVEIDAPEFMSKITECINSFSYNKNYLCIQIMCNEFKALSNSAIR